jgi:hypothetical protein
MSMLYAAQLDWGRRESYIWSWHRRWSQSNSSSYSRQLKSRELMPRELWKQEAPTLTIWGWRSCVPKGLTNEGVKRFRVKGKVSPHYIGPFPILEKCETMVYKLELPPLLVGVHYIFLSYPVLRNRNEASIRVPRMFKSHAWQQYDKQMQCY